MSVVKKELSIIGFIDSAVVLSGLLEKLEDLSDSLQAYDQLGWLERIAATGDLTLSRSGDCGFDLKKLDTLADFCTWRKLSWRLLEGTVDQNAWDFNILRTWMPGFKNETCYTLLDNSEPAISLAALQKAQDRGPDAVDQLIRLHSVQTRCGVDQSLKVDPALLAAFRLELSNHPSIGMPRYV